MMSRRTHRVLYSISCVKCSSVYIGQTGRSLKQYMWQSALPSTEEWGRTSKHLPWQSMSSRLDMQLTSSSLRYSHQHTTTCCMLESWHIQPNQVVLNREQGTATGSACGAPGLMACIYLSPCFLFYFFLLYIAFVSIVNNLTQYWCAWDHAVCMCRGTPKTDWHVPMCAGVESSYLAFILDFNIHLTVL